MKEKDGSFSFAAPNGKAVRTNGQLQTKAGCIQEKGHNVGKLIIKEQKALPISKHDPDQSWGKVRKKYC